MGSHCYHGPEEEGKEIVLGLEPERTGQPTGTTVSEDIAPPGRKGVGVTAKRAAAGSPRQQRGRKKMNLTGQVGKGKQRTTSTCSESARYLDLHTNRGPVTLHPAVKLHPRSALSQEV